MPFAAVVGSVFPAAYMRGSRETFGLFPGEMNFPRYADCNSVPVNGIPNSTATA